jgi:RimJ/RimL family protein N-acetyltransferase
VHLILPSSARLAYAPLSLEDANFIVALLNDDDFRRYIGDRGVRNRDDVDGYLQAGPLRSYAEHGFGLLKIAECATGKPVGIAGLLKRPALADVDLGYALLPGFRRRGYATEACEALIRLAAGPFRLTRLVAIVSPDNLGSIATLERVGFAFERMLRLQGDAADVRLYGRALPAADIAPGPRPAAL